ncbi:MAG: cyclic pyranopterin monophosphate synthase MoaC [Parvibaculaceae bacterium]|nr:cyclic pyranopterin monophosphate synthase MoaC [Parvibaculaceae bacterium]
MTGKLSHLDEKGEARMVDVSEKSATARMAVAKGVVQMEPATLRLIVEGALAKGEVLQVARIAGIMAAKRTADLIPLCHPLSLSSVTIEFAPDEARSLIEVTATAKVTGPTGVEMEALTAASVACLTIYDMAKAVDRAMRITDLRLVHKSGGKSGTFEVA